MSRGKINKLLSNISATILCLGLIIICTYNIPVSAAEITAAIDYTEEIITVDGGDDGGVLFYSVGKDIEKASGQKAKWYPLVGRIIDISKVIPKKADAVIYIGLKYSDDETKMIEVKGRPDIKILKTEVKTLYNGTNAFVNQSSGYDIEFKVGLTYDWTVIEKSGKSDEIYYIDMFPNGATGVVRIKASESSFASAEVKFKVKAIPKAPNGDKIVFEHKKDVPTIKGLTDKMEVCKKVDLSTSEMFSVSKDDYNSFWLDIKDKNMKVIDFAKALTDNSSLDSSNYIDALSSFLKDDDYVFSLRFKATDKKSVSSVTTFKISKTDMERAFTAQPSNAISLIDIESPVGINNQGSVTVKGLPKTEYSIEVYYPSGESIAQGLENKTSDKDGIVSWTWKIGSNTTPGTHSLTISGDGASLEVEFVVVEQQ